MTKCLSLPLAPSGTIVRHWPHRRYCVIVSPHAPSPCCPPTSCSTAAGRYCTKRRRRRSLLLLLLPLRCLLTWFAAQTSPGLLAEPNRRNRLALSYTALLPSPPPAILAARSPLYLPVGDVYVRCARELAKGPSLHYRVAQGLSL